MSTSARAAGKESGHYPRDERHRIRRSVTISALTGTLLVLLAIEGVLAYAIAGSAGTALQESLAARGITVADDAVQQAIGRARRRGLAYAAVSALALSSAALVLVLVKLLERSRHRLVRMERLATAGTLAATIAHEVKNPMGIILSTTQLLSRSPGIPESDRRLLSDIEEEVRRADDQLNAFLDLARDMPMKRNPCDLGEIARSTISMLSAQAKQAQVALQLEPGCDSITVIADRRRLRQALINIVLNGIEALAPASGGRITIRLSQPVPDSAAITVADDGPGMPAAIQTVAFEAFMSTKPNGTGLGLSTARRIVERHGGRLTLTSAVGSGTTVTMLLPCRERGTSGIFHLRNRGASPAARSR